MSKWATLVWLLTRRIHCPWGCGEWVRDEFIVGHFLVEHGGD